MNTVEFAVEGRAVKIRKTHPRGTPMDITVIVDALSKVYPELAGISLTDLESAGALALTRFGSIAPFAEIAAHIISLTGLAWQDVRTGIKPDTLNAAYQDYLYDDTGFWDEVQKQIEALDNPNGPTAGKVSEQQAANPLSETPGASS